MSDKVTISSGKGFKFLKDTLRETNQQKVEIRVIHVPNPKTNSIHHVNLEIIKYVKKPSQPWSSATTSKIRLTSEKPEESIQKLLVFLRAQSSLEKYTNAVVEIARSPSNSLTAEDMEFVRKILSSFDTPEKRECWFVQKKKMFRIYMLRSNMLKTKRQH